MSVFEGRVLSDEYRSGVWRGGVVTNVGGRGQRRLLVEARDEALNLGGQHLT